MIKIEIGGRGLFAWWRDAQERRAEHDARQAAAELRTRELLTPHFRGFFEQVDREGLSREYAAGLVLCSSLRVYQDTTSSRRAERLLIDAAKRLKAERRAAFWRGLFK